MSDGPPTEDRAVSTILDYIALACIFGFVEQLLAGKYWRSAAALVAAVIFHVIGIKWPKIKPKISATVTTSVERIASNRLSRRVIYFAIAIVLLITVGVKVY